MVSLFGIQVDGHDEAVETQDLGENKDEDHADVEAGLLGRAAYAGVAHYAHRVAGRQTGQTHRQPGAQVHKASAKKKNIVKF